MGGDRPDYVLAKGELNGAQNTLTRNCLVRHWLLKTEPESFSIDDLAASPNRTTCWDGVRNYQARNFLRDDFRVGDRVLFYHSNASPPAVMGVAEVVGESYPDPTALDPRHHHYDPGATAENPRWVMVDVRLVEKFARPVSLDELRQQPSLARMELLRRGSRLSVQPVTAEEYAIVVGMGGKAPDTDEQASPTASTSKSKATSQRRGSQKNSAATHRPTTAAKSSRSQVSAASAKSKLARSTNDAGNSTSSRSRKPRS